MNKIKAGSGVYHKPSGEKWFVLGINYEKGKLCVAGWPPTIAEISDCVLINDPRRELTTEEIEHRNRQFGTDWE